MADDWNVVVSVGKDSYRRARRFLRQFGRVERAGFYNVLVLAVDDVSRFLEALREAAESDPAAASCLARVTPVTTSFTFRDAAEFETRLREAASQFLPALAGKTFYVRMHRRGFRDALSSQHQEQLLDRFLLESLEHRGYPGRISFADPDAVLAIETVGNRAGLSLWTREQLQRYPFLRFQ